MPQEFKELRKNASVGEGVIGANSLALTTADAVNISTTGFLQLVAAAAERILGFSVDQRTLSATNQTVAAVRPLYITAEDCVMIFGTSADLARTDVGTYKDFDTVTTGAFRVGATSIGESSTGTSTGQLLCVDIDPRRESNNDLAVFRSSQPIDVATGAV